jgi:hypothetical protein
MSMSGRNGIAERNKLTMEDAYFIEDLAEGIEFGRAHSQCGAGTLWTESPKDLEQHTHVTISRVQKCISIPTMPITSNDIA